jgi:uncharacterized Zn finger protein
MRELSWCPKCCKKKWADITIIEIDGTENKITTTCPKCGTVVTKVIGKESLPLKTSKDS